MGLARYGHIETATNLDHMEIDRCNLDADIRIGRGYIVLRKKDKYGPSAITPVQFGEINHTINSIRIIHIRNVATRWAIGLVVSLTVSQVVGKSIRIWRGRVC